MPVLGHNRCVLNTLFNKMHWFRQEPDSEAGRSAFHDVPTSEASESITAPPTCASTEDETIADEQMSMSVPDVAAVASSADTSAQLSVAENDVAQSSDVPKPEAVFAAAAVKPRLEVKNDLSSMFKSLSAKMKMKRQRQSRFTDIDTVVSATLESDSLSSDADLVMAEAPYVPTDAASDSSRTFLTSASMALLSGEGVAVCGSTNIGLPHLLSHVTPVMPLSVSSRDEAFAVHLQKYDMQQMTSSGLLLTSNEHVSALPAFTPAESASAQNNSKTMMTFSVPNVVSSQHGL